MYNITVVPQVPIRHVNAERYSCQLLMRVPYNTLFNVSISASVMCGESSTSHIELYYGQ